LGADRRAGNRGGDRGGAFNQIDDAVSLRQIAVDVTAVQRLFIRRRVAAEDHVIVSKDFNIKLYCGRLMSKKLSAE